MALWGALASGLVWLISAFVAFKYSDTQAVWTLLIGGMFIFPLSALFSKMIGLSGNHTKGNPLAQLAMEGTIFMLMCLPLALGLSLQHNEWFFSRNVDDYWWQIFDIFIPLRQ